MDVLSFQSPPDPLVDFSGVTAELMGPFLMADNVNQLEILSCEEQFVEIIHVYISALTILQCLSECRDHSPLLFYPETYISFSHLTGFQDNSFLSYHYQRT